MDVAPSYFVYKITSKIDNRVYIGKSKLKRSRNRHRMKEHYAADSFIGRTIRKYGIENFDFSIIEFFLKEEEAYEAEVYWIYYYRSQNKKHGFNLTPGGLGVKEFSQETIEKLRKANIGKKLSDETKQKMSFSHKGEKNHNFGKKMSDEQKKKISDANKNRPVSDITKRKLSLSKSGEQNNFFGKTHSLDSRKKMSLAHKNKKLSTEHKLKIGLSFSGEKSSTAKLTKKEVLEIREQRKNGAKLKDLAIKYNISFSCIKKIVNNKTWRNL